MNIDLELLKAEIKIAEEEIYRTKSGEFIDGYDTCKELVDKYLTESNEKDRNINF